MIDSGISICIPTYSRHRLAIRCVESLLRQTLLPTEIIVSANSPEDFYMLNDHFQSSKRIVRVIGGDNVGVNNNFLRAVKSSMCEHVLLMADDMYLASASSLESAIKHLKADDEEVIISPVSKITIEDRILDCTRYECTKRNSTERILQYASQIRSDNTVFYSIYPRRVILEMLTNNAIQSTLFGKNWTGCGDWLAFSDALFCCRNEIAEGFCLIRDENAYDDKPVTQVDEYQHSYQRLYHIESIACGFFSYFMRMSLYHRNLPAHQRYELGRQCAFSIFSNYCMQASAKHLIDCLSFCYEDGDFFADLWHDLIN